ncbi:MAG: hypothetical protein ACLFUJ_10900 [Phycisphaerae bacterium]
MARHSGRSRSSQARKPRHCTAPEPLGRAPQVKLEIRIEELDERTFQAIDAVAGQIQQRIEQATSLDELRLLTTKAHLLLAMKSTHRSIGRLVMGSTETAIDALPLTRMQLERCFLALLIEDQPGRWYKRYRKNAWKAFAEKFFRDQHCLGHLEPYDAYFDPNGPGIQTLRAFSREMDVWEDELQTLRIMIRGEEMDPRWDKRFIADMPTPGKALHVLEVETHRRLARMLYPYYDNLSHFSHGGLAGVMEAAILRNDPVSGEADGQISRDEFFRSSVLEQTLPLSYVSMLFVATLHCAAQPLDQEIHQLLARTWQPYHSDGSPMGIALWDGWAGNALAAQAQPAE